MNPSEPRAESEEQKRVPRVAVVGVHGIARHPAGETENAMADLLLSLPVNGRVGDQRPVESNNPGMDWRPDDGRRYGPFKAVGIQIPLQRVRVKPVSLRTRNGFSLEEPIDKFAKFLRLKRRSIRKAVRADSEGWEGSETGNEFTSLLLGHYWGGADTNAYVTTRLEGERSAMGEAGAGQAEGTVDAKVDIYEVLWADLAHPESSIVGFFLSLFTLLLHLGSLSRYAVETGAGENEGALWWMYMWAQRWAVRVLQIFLPLFKVLMLVVILSAIPGISSMLSQATAAQAFAAGVGAVGGIGGILLGYILTKSIRWPLGRSAWLWAFTTLLPGAIGAGLGYWLAVRHFGSAQAAASVLCWVCLGAPILGYILSKYDDYRFGAQFWGWAGYLLCLVGYIELLRVAPAHDVSLAAFWLVEFVVAAIRISWLAMCAFALLAVVLGSLAWRRKPENSGARARLRAAVRTSRFALAMPAVFLLLVTPLLWSAMFKVVDWVRKPFFCLDGHENDGIIAILPWLVRWNLIPDASKPAIFGDYLKSVLGWGLGYQLPITLLFLSLGIFVMVWWVLPSALLETFTQRDKQEPPRRSTNAQSLHLGSWLSRGLDATSVATFLFWCSIFLAFPAVHLLGFIDSHWATCSLEALTCITMWIVVHPLLAVSGAAVVAMVKYGSSVLETILDVDTYLRASPVDATPRAKIFERFVSTLRYVASYRDKDGNGYDSVVIVAHSLGALIAADLLRYLYAAQSDPARSDPALDRYGFGTGGAEIELKLLTMGAPIRQLLNRFFPYLYDWVRPYPDNGLEPLLSPAETPPYIDHSDPPDPSKLGLAQWANAYRSGDYVGRSLWLDEWYKRTASEGNEGRWPAPIQKVSSDCGTRLEMCIGAGAHVHYWDDTAPDVAEVLDSLIG
jgi:hypothetical protein